MAADFERDVNGDDPLSMRQLVGDGTQAYYYLETSGRPLHAGRRVRARPP